MLGRFLRSLGIRAEERPDPSPSRTHETLVRSREGVAAHLAGGAEPTTAIALAFLDAEASAGAEGYTSVPDEERALFARAWLSLVLDNERLAPSMQLTDAEMAQPRKLLASFFFGSPTIQSEAQDVLRFIEARFASGRYAQASLLLQLFETDAATQRNNERNLAHESTALALTATRTGAVTADMRAEFDLVASKAVAEGAEGLRLLAAWYAARCDVRFHVLAQDVGEVATWGESLVDADATARDQVLEIVPPWCNRPIDQLEGDVETLLLGHAAHVGVHDAIQGLLRSIYFTVLMPGRTGFEPLIVEWVRWGETAFEDPIARVLPDLHRRTIVLEQRLGAAIHAVSDTWMSRHDLHGRIGPEAIAEAAAKVLERLTSVDPVMVPEGDYDLGGLVMDELLGFRPRRVTDSLRLHRRT